MYIALDVSDLFQCFLVAFLLTQIFFPFTFSSPVCHCFTYAICFCLCLSCFRSPCFSLFFLCIWQQTTSSLFLLQPLFCFRGSPT